MKQATPEVVELEKQGHVLVREMRYNTKKLATLIGKIPHPLALMEAQNAAMAIGVMMMDLLTHEPEFFFVVWPIIEKDFMEAKAACDLMRMRLKQPLVREQMNPTRN